MFLLQTLLQLGADPNLRSRIDGKSAFSIATAAGNIAILSLLIEYGADDAAYLKRAMHIRKLLHT